MAKYPLISIGEVTTMPERATSSIGAGASLGAAVSLAAFGMPLGVETDADWDAAAMTFQGSFDGETYVDVVDEYGTEVSLGTLSAGVNSRPLGIDLILNLMRFQYVKPRSGTTDTATNQTDATVVTFVGRPW